VGLSVGDIAPEFTLPGTGGREYSLSEFRGKPVVLVFYPGDDTPVCTKQLSSYSHDLSQFESVGAQVLAVSAQGIESHEKFSGKLGLGFPLLADMDKKVAQAYGALGPMAFPGDRCSSSMRRAPSGTSTVPSPVSPTALRRSWSPRCDPRAPDGPPSD